MAVRRRWRSVAVAAGIFGVLIAPSAQAVVGGTPASRASYPFFAVVGSACGGALVAPDRVLTAAHCHEFVEELPRVRVGPANERRAVHRLAIHPRHERWKRRSDKSLPPGPADLMLLDLKRPVSDVRPVAIPPASAGLTAPGTEVVTIGRGATDPDGSGGGVFREATVSLRDVADCPEQLPDAATRRWSLCAIDPRALDPAASPPFASACLGDSGGPLLAARGEELVTVGVVSWGPACGAERDPEIYANAVRGRSFALDREPTWAPRTRGRPRVAWRPRVGRRVRCRARWIVRAKHPIWDFVVGGREVQSGRRATYRIRRADRNKKLACGVSGRSAGGSYGSSLSRPVRVSG